ncbi:thymidylate synthase [uncultured phage cr125_1]|uniref:Thymidylate synthase n=1 Tax=uncultured phage cr125_1 TaxID=2772091 RepID=A0A7M1RV71_9CAUD|nr:thymidylate synthase [uncultured phage cr125_1]QOR57589.1 thymidylate synthase [uncultured phage cr125_1]
MKLIESSVQIIKEKDPYKMIELAGRTCYKSEDKITEDSAKKFVDRMIKLGHGAMLEHGTIYLACLVFDGDVDNNNNLTPNHSFYKYQSNKYSKVKVAQYAWSGEDVACVTTNLRVLVENNWLDDLKTYRCEPTRYHEKRITAKFICDRGVSHEFVRHRVFSFAQESTRYCNYSKDKFNNELTLIKPSWIEESIDSLNQEFRDTDRDDTSIFIRALRSAEEEYFTLLNNGWKPQQARQVLPNATKTELVMTGFESDWEGFFKLRCSGAAHPDAKKLADELRELMVK